MRGHGRCGAAAAQEASFTGSGNGRRLRSAFGAAGAVAAALDFAVLALAPFWQAPAPAPVPRVECVEQDGELVAGPVPAPSSPPSAPSSKAASPEALALPPAPTPEPTPHALVHPASDLAAATRPPRLPTAAAGLRSALAALPPAGLRLLPHTPPSGGRRWLVFGLSSINRKKADYLGLTLSHLYDALSENGGVGHSTAIVVHLADFDEAWVNKTQQWLGTSFTDEVEAGALHTIHAPERLYPSKEEASRLRKFGDSPERQWWRAKQNLDYAFLMWYSADLAEYYMQLEDDVQVVPGFLTKVSNFLASTVQGRPWTMVSFSKLGFIGKFFNSSHLHGLAEFLLVFYDEAPCDWLIWVFIDTLSPLPVTASIPVDLEVEFQLMEMQKRQKRNPETVEEPRSMRTDIKLFYKDAPGDLFLSRPFPPQTKPPASRPADKWTNGPRGSGWSNMKPWKDSLASNAYPPVNNHWFWSSDTCWQARVPCDASTKFVGIRFEEALNLGAVVVEMGPAKHPGDWVHNGTLEATSELSCSAGYSELAHVARRRLEWRGIRENVRCLRVRLLAHQQEWVMLRFVLVERADLSPIATIPATAKPSPAASRPAPVPSRPTGSAGGVALAMRLQALPPTPGPAAGLPAEAEAAVEAAAAVGSEPLGGSPPPDDGAAGGSAARGEEVALAAVLAASLGLTAGLAGWAFVIAGWRYCRHGVEVVGSCTCWLAGFLVVLNVLLLACFRPPAPLSPARPQMPCAAVATVVALPVPVPPLPEAAVVAAAAPPPPPPPPTPAQPPLLDPLPPAPPPRAVAAAPPPKVLDSAAAETLGPPATARAAAAASAASGPPGQSSAGISQLLWPQLRPAVRTMDLGALQVVGPGRWPGRKNWLMVGLLTNASHTSERVAGFVRSLLEAGEELSVALHATDPDGVRRERLLQALQTEFAGQVHAGRLHALHAPEEVYPAEATGRDNTAYAMLLMFAAPLARFYMQVDLDSPLKPGFFRLLRDYLRVREGDPWHMVSLSKMGFHRKVLRAALLPRMAELLAMFPAVPADALLWDFLDIVGNQSEPKACYLAIDAIKHQRPDVILQYHGSETLIEHLGDVSSLEGKVQRIHDDYFRSHRLKTTLFDNPLATLRTSVPSGGANSLQQVYGQSRGNKAFKSAGIVSAAPGAEAFIEVVFHQPVDLEIFMLRMGGFNCGDEADPDMEHTLEGAELEFGRDLEAPRQASGPRPPVGAGCGTYERMAPVGGREVFWRSQQSRPAKAVHCIRVVTRRPQETPLVVRGLCVRSSQRRQGSSSASKLTGTMSWGALPAAPARAVSQTGLPAGAIQVPGTSSRPPPPPTTTTPTMPTTAASSSSLSRARFLQRRRAEAAAGAHSVAVPTGPDARLGWERWHERHVAWVLTTSVSFTAGATMGLLGLAAARLTARRWGPEKSESSARGRSRTRNGTAAPP